MVILQLLHSPFAFLVLFLGILGIVALYQWLIFQRPINTGAEHFRAKRYEKAAAVFQTVLKRHPPAGIEADTRRRLADTLDVLGQSENADQERERAGSAALKGAKDPTALITQGDLLRRQHRYDDACKMYGSALGQIPTGLFPSVRAQIMAKLTVAHFEAGRPTETLRWAKAALASSPDKETRRSMESMAGVAAGNQGDLETAEGHYRAALALAEAKGKPEEIAQSLATLADIQRKRGHLADALATARRAVAVCDSPFRGGRLAEIESLREMGRLDEARAAAGLMKQGPRHDQPDVERRMQAMSALSLAWVEIAADRPEAALPALEETREHLKAAARSTVWPPEPAGGEDKLGLYCDAAQMRVQVQLGTLEAAQRLRTSIEGRISRYADDRGIMMSVYGQFARAAYFAGDYGESREFCQRYLDCKPSPAGLPTVYYWLGENHLRLGETDTARDFFKQAVAPSIDSLDARRAAARLNELGG